MKVILSNMCASLVGTLERGLGYHLEHRKNGFFAVRNNTSVPPDGHWRFIVLCAELVQNHLYLSDIEVSRNELRSALREARQFVAARQLKLETYHARDILNLKTTFGL
jgi:hypothetical protein